MPYFSFIMVCYNNWEFTRNALDSFFEYLDPAHQSRGIELIIVDNASTDETSKSIQGYKEFYNGVVDIEIVNLKQNHGYILGANAGLAEAKGEIVTILNNDLVFCPNWFTGLINALEKDPSVGIAAPLLTNGSGTENITLEFKSPEDEKLFYKSKRTMNHCAQRIMSNNRQAIIPSNRIIGACIAMKKEVVQSIGGLDFWFGVGLFDDDDFTIRVNIAGYKSVIVGSSFVYHMGSATFKKENQVVRSAIISNKTKFILKWDFRTQDNPGGQFANRTDVIRNSIYWKDPYYFPTSISQYRRAADNPCEKRNEYKKQLLIADWTNYNSEWQQKLEMVLSNLDKGSNIYFWIPKNYFPVNEVKSRVNSILESLELVGDEAENYFRYLDYAVMPIDLLAFISSFDSLISVEKDFINMYFTDLAAAIHLPVE